MTTHLRSVDRNDEHTGDTANMRENVTTDSRIPDFEGQPVDSARLKLAAVNKLEAGEGWSRIDDTVRMYVEGRVVAVHHAVDEQSGHLIRVHTIKVVDAVQLPWDFDAGQFEG